MLSIDEVEPQQSHQSSDLVIGTDKVNKPRGEELVQIDVVDKYYPALRLDAQKVQGGQKFFRVVWKGKKNEKTWEPQENISLYLISDFYKNFTKAGKRRKRK